MDIFVFHGTNIKGYALFNLFHATDLFWDPLSILVINPFRATDLLIPPFSGGIKRDQWYEMG